MPKKLHTNPKAQEARDREKAVKDAKKSAEQKALEDSKWADEGQSAKEKRAAAAEAKRVEEQKKKEIKKLINQTEGEQNSQLKQAKVAKVTQFQLQQAQVKLEKEREIVRKKEEEMKQKILPQQELTDNPNLIINESLEEDIRMYGADSVVHASSLDEAIEELKKLRMGGSGDSSVPSSSAEDRHPEKRLRAAFEEFQQREMSEMKEENPSLRLSQLKELIWKKWQKSAENPLNVAKAQRKAEVDAATMVVKTKSKEEDKD